MGSQRAQVAVLPLGTLGVSAPRYLGCEILDAGDLMMRSQKISAKGVKIQPLVRSAFHRAIIEVEAINVDYCSHAARQTNRGHVSQAHVPPHPGSKPLG